MAECKKIRVLMLLDYLNISGTKTHVLSLAKYFMSRGIYVLVAGKRGPFSKILEQAGCPVYHINFYGKAKKIETRLEQLINRENINIIHNHSPFSGVYAAKVSRSLNVPLVATFHGTYYSKYKFFNKMLTIANASNALISVSPAVKEYLRQLGIQSECIPLGIDLRAFGFKSKTNVREQFGIPIQSSVVLYPARQEGTKADIGFHVMEACYELRETYGMNNIQCIIAGDGNKITKVRNKATEYNNKSGETFIHVIGKYYDMPSLYSASSIVVGTGLTAIEAMACERPLIAAGIQGFFGVVDEGNFDKAWNNGFGDHRYDKLPTFDTVQFINSLKEIFLCPDSINKLGKMGRRKVEAQFDKSVNNRLINIYESLVHYEQENKEQ